MADWRAIFDAVVPVLMAGISLTLFLTSNEEPAWAFLGASIGSAPGGIRRGNPRDR